MKILQVCPDFYMELGGISVHVQNIAERLAKRHDVTVYATNCRSKYPRYEVKNCVKVERFNCFAPGYAYFFSWDMLLRFRKVEFDVVHGHGYHAFPLHFSRLAKGKKFIVTTHFHGAGHTPFRNCLVRLLKRFGEETLRKADKIIAVSQFEKDLLIRYFKIDPKKAIVIPNGVDFSEFSGLKRQNHDFRSILYVGNLASYKGPQYLVEVLPKLPDDVVLEIVGDGPLKPFLEKRARELNVYNRIRLQHNLERRQLLQKFADADVFILLSKYEAYSLVVAEALASGTPCIVADTCALSEWIDGASCFGVSLPVSLNKLANLINYVLNTRVNRENVKAHTRKKVLDWDEVVERLVELYTA